MCTNILKNIYFLLWKNNKYKFCVDKYVVRIRSPYICICWCKFTEITCSILC